MAVQGGYIEEKTIGISIDMNGTFKNTELVNGKIRLKQIDGQSSVFYSEGEWISSVINIGDNFKDYGKLFVTHIDEEGSSITVFTRSSGDGINFSDWIEVATDESIQSTKNRFIMAKVAFYASIGIGSVTLLPKDPMHNEEYIKTSSKNGVQILQLKREYQHAMTLDSNWSDTGSLHRKTIAREDWIRIDKLNITKGSV